MQQFTVLNSLRTGYCSTHYTYYRPTYLTELLYIRQV